MKPLLPAALILLASSAFAVQTATPRGQRIGVVVPGHRSRGVERSLNTTMPHYLCNELRKMGFDARLVRSKVLDQGGSHDEDLIVEMTYTNAEGHSALGVGTGGRVGSVGVGGEISIIVTRVLGEVRISDPRTGEVLRSFELESRSTGPALTGIGVGGRHGYLSFGLPFYRSYLYRTASRLLARDAAVKIAENLSPNRR